jgi:hypothetical protein
MQGWGVRGITVIDSGEVSFSNSDPVQQPVLRLRSFFS